MNDEVSAHQKMAMDWLTGGNAARWGDIGLEVGKWAAGLVAELADAKQEAKHWQQAFEAVRAEIKVMASVCIGRKGGKLLITLQDYEAVKGKELFVGGDNGTRVYELRQPQPTDALAAKNGTTSLDAAVASIIRPH